jgi:D-sedoheptulose 7-phosphate isomerase
MLNNLIERYPQLIEIKDELKAAANLMIKTVRGGGKILLCGNGGSCADCDHIVGELMKGFLLKREVGEEFIKVLKNAYPDDAEYLSRNLQGGIPAISLTSQSAVLSAFANDVAPDMHYAQLVYGYGNKGDLLIGISTSGNSKNVVNAVKVAKAKGLYTVALTGKTSCKLDMCDIALKAPETETFKVQEYHLPMYHYLCAEVEKCLFGNE